MDFLFKKLILALIISLAVSCVGTIDDKTVPQTNAIDTTPTITYNGIHSATAISHQRIEVFFPVSNLNADDVVYVISVDSSATPIYVPGASTTLFKDYRNLFMYTLRDLDQNSSYEISVEVLQVSEGVTSSSGETEIVSTFAEKTAIFDGISSSENIPGASGLNALKINWNAADSIGGLISKDEIDPIAYNVIALNADAGRLPTDFFNEGFTPPERIVWQVPANSVSSVISGLASGTNYYVMVQAIHHGSTLSSSASLEGNSRYTQISTLDSSSSSVTFASDSFSLTTPIGQSGLSSLKAAWGAPEGNFDHFRIFYSTSLSDVDTVVTGPKDSLCDGAEVAVPNVSCVNADFSTFSSTITGLTENTVYYARVLVCIDFDCNNYVISDSKSAETKPDLISFAGISSIDVLTDFNDLDKLYINFPIPDLDTGILDGLKLYEVDTGTGAETEISTLPGLSSLYHTSYNHLVDSQIEVLGVTYNSVYCFKLVPYITGDPIDTSLYTAVCATIAYTPITKFDFPGLDSVTCNTTVGHAMLQWNAPITGLFSHFEIEWTWGATTGTILVPNSGASSYVYTVPGLQTGTTQFKVKTFINIEGTEMRSEENVSTTETCVMP